MIEFLGQLIKAMERFILNDMGTSGVGVKPSRRTSVIQSVGTHSRSSTATPPVASSPSPLSSSIKAAASGLILSAEMVQHNTGIVYEILDECMVILSLQK
jgi:hypothetical protein